MTFSGTRVIVSMPDGSEAGRMSVDMLAALARARDERAAACFLRPPVLVNDALFNLTTTDVPLIQARGLSHMWARSRWQMTEWAGRRRTQAAKAAASFWTEWYRELRRQVADQRLPIDLRGTLRDAAHRSFDRAQRNVASVPRFPRAAIRDRIRVQLPEPLRAAAAAAAASAGLAIDCMSVVVEMRARRDSLAPALELLAAHGYSVVPLGRSPLVDVFALLTAAFAICETSDAQRTAYLTNTPTLAINATDAYTFYPLRADGVYLLKTAIDLDSGRELSSTELLGEPFYRNQRNCGFRDNSAADISAAVSEMIESVASGAHDTDGQARFRANAVETGAAIAARVRHVAKWGPVNGFIGDGRLARVQADREP